MSDQQQQLSPQLGQVSSVTTTVQASHDTIDVYREVLGGIQTGSYAVLLAIAVVYVMTRQAMGRAWHKHFEMLETLKSTQLSNANALKTIAESNRRIADILSDPRLISGQQGIEVIRAELMKAQIQLESHSEKSDESTL